MEKLPFNLCIAFLAGIFMNFVTPAFSSPTPTPTAIIIPTPAVTATITITPTQIPCEDVTAIKVDTTELIFSKKAIGSWVITTIDSGDSVGWYSSIALDSSGKVHISYYDMHNRDLKYATNASGSWVTTIVDSIGYSNSTSIALDSSDRAHISYSAGGALKYATNASDFWVITTVDRGGGCEYTSMSLDSSDKAHISCFYTNFYTNTTQEYITSEPPREDLKYATNASGSWVITTLDSGGAYEYTSIALDSSDKVHISYCDWNDYDLKYATNVSGSWVTTTVDSSGAYEYYTSIALDSSDKVHISYHDNSYQDLKYATNDSGSWVTTIVDSSGGKHTSIALNSSGKVYISYCGWNDYDLKYATNASGSWVTTIVDSGGYSRSTSIALDAFDKAHISYKYFSHGMYNSSDLKYATNAPFTVTVIVTGENECPVKGKTVTPKINKAGMKCISILPKRTSTDENGKATFTITAKNKTGNARVTFKAGVLKKSIVVKVRR